TVCFYCACNKIVTKRRDRATPYLDHLYREIEMQGALYDNSRPVDQLHWGGGTPTFLSHDQMRTLMEKTGQHFSLMGDDQGEYSIEIDPREITADGVHFLRDIGFNRLSLGIQDFDAKVQKAVNRIQSEEITFAAINAAREAKFKSVSVDLIYGLPFQSVDSFLATLDKIMQVDPDRLSVFNYAHLPALFMPQRRINEEDLPSAAEKLEILQAVIQYLTDKGYVYVGMDHFAKPGDELVIAQDKGRLYRNFQGYSTHADCDMVAMGVTAISQVNNIYSQNVRDEDSYYQMIDEDKLPLMRGLILTDDDLLRRDLISQLICNFRLDMEKFGIKYNINFADYFSNELSRLEVMQEDELLQINDNSITVLPAGRLLIRNICMTFDAHLKDNQKNRFSKVI
ncbi:MAG: oxygen-independent coproporphyrinogen III oxidase, partial [Pseudomonadota bacterium]|nr:oxygen-independent coproporphyrinogen III oxidase [Pseudomonadota bacterium]